MPNINNLLQDHVELKCFCVDRIFLNGYVAGFRTPQGSRTASASIVVSRSPATRSWAR
jgi:hypothetical protein